MPVSSRSDNKPQQIVDQVTIFSGNSKSIRSDLWGDDSFTPYIFDYYDIGNMKSIIIALRVTCASWSALTKQFNHDFNLDDFFIKKVIFDGLYNYIWGVIPLSLLILFLVVSIIVHFLLAIIFSVLIVPLTLLQALIRTPARFTMYVDIFYNEGLNLDFFTDLEPNVQAKRSKFNRSDPYKLIQMPFISRLHSVLKNHLYYQKIFFFEFYSPIWMPVKKPFHISWHIVLFMVYLNFLFKLIYSAKEQLDDRSWIKLTYSFYIYVYLRLFLLPTMKLIYSMRWFSLAWRLLEWFCKVTILVLCFIFILPYF